MGPRPQSDIRGKFNNALKGSSAAASSRVKPHTTQEWGGVSGAAAVVVEYIVRQMSIDRRVSKGVCGLLGLIRRRRVC
jgi:hypothetical protein